LNAIVAPKEEVLKIAEDIVTPEWEVVSKLPVFERMKGENYEHTETVVRSVNALMRGDHRALFALTGKGKSPEIHYRAFAATMEKLRTFIRASIAENADVRGDALIALLPQVHDIGKGDALYEVGRHNHWHRSADLLDAEVLSRLDLKLTPKEVELLKLAVQDHNYPGEIWMATNLLKGTNYSLDALAMYDTLQEHLAGVSDERYHLIMALLVANLLGDVSSWGALKNIPATEFVQLFNEMLEFAGDRQKFEGYRKVLVEKLGREGVKEPEKDIAALQELAAALGENHSEEPVLTIKVQVEKILVKGDLAEIRRAQQLLDAIGQEMRERYALTEPYAKLMEHALAGFLSASDSDLSDIQADYLILAGNDDIAVLDEAYRLYKEGRVKKILISGGVGRLTIDLVAVAVRMGVIKELKGKRFQGLSGDELIPVLETLKKEVMADLKKAIDEKMIGRELGIGDEGEADILKKILLSGREIDPADIIVESKSATTNENFENSLAIIHQRENGRPVTVAFMHTPLQQFRTKAIFAQTVKNHPEYGSYTGISHTIPLQIAEQKGLRANTVREMWRILIRAVSNDLLPSYKGAYGLQSIPEEYWSMLIPLIESFAPAERADLVNSLLALAKGYDRNFAVKSFLALLI
jgi:uncharacterized SAM-binding protein YcdF (DUF218 family)